MKAVIRNIPSMWWKSTNKWVPKYQKARAQRFNSRYIEKWFHLDDYIKGHYEKR